MEYIELDENTASHFFYMEPQVFVKLLEIKETYGLEKIEISSRGGPSCQWNAFVFPDLDEKLVDELSNDVDELCRAVNYNYKDLPYCMFLNNGTEKQSLSFLYGN